MEQYSRPTVVDDEVDWRVQLPGEVAEEAEHRETGEDSCEEVHDRHEDRLAVKCQPQ